LKKMPSILPWRVGNVVHRHYMAEAAFLRDQCIVERLGLLRCVN
jgi:hypothetical protein